MKDKKPATKCIGPAQYKLFNPTMPVLRKPVPNRRGKADSVPVKLYISGRNLKDMDLYSKSDPICVVMEKAADNDLWFEVGRTEFQANNLNPDFKTTIDLEFFFEREQLLRFEFIDDDGGDDGQPFYDVIGINTIPLSSIMASRGQTVTRALVHPTKVDKARGMMIIKAESIKESNHQICFQIFTKNLRNRLSYCGGVMWLQGRTSIAIERQS